MIRDTLFAATCGAIALLAGIQYGQSQQDPQPADKPAVELRIEDDAKGDAEAPAELMGHTYDVLGEQVLQLPEDGSQWHTSVFVQVDPTTRTTDAAGSQVLAAFNRDPRLSRLRASTKWHIYEWGGVIHRERFANAVTETPAVVLQRGDGSIVCKVCGPRLVELLDILPDYVAMKVQAEQRCPGPYCPSPLPSPLPTPQPTPGPMLPDVGPVAPPADDPEPQPDPTNDVLQLLQDAKAEDLIVPGLVAAAAFLLARRRK